MIPIIDWWEQWKTILNTPMKSFNPRKHVFTSFKGALLFGLGIVIIEINHPTTTLENTFASIVIIGFCIFGASIGVGLINWGSLVVSKKTLFRTFAHSFGAFLLLYLLGFAIFYFLRIASDALHWGLFYGEWNWKILWTLIWRNFPFALFIYTVFIVFEYKKIMFEREIQQVNASLSSKKEFSNRYSSDQSYPPLSFPSDGFNIAIAPNDITHITVQEHYLYIHFHAQESTEGASLKKIMIRKPLREMVEELPKALFLRIHRSHIVNIAHITKLKRMNGRYFVFIYQDQFSLPVSRSYLSQTLSYVISVTKNQ